MKITSIKIGTAKTGNPFKTIVLEDDRKINVFNNHSLYGAIVEGYDIPETMIEQSGQYLNLKDIQPKPAFKGKQIAEAQERKAEYIKQAQDRKEDSIAFFNATNAAIALLKDKDFKDGELQEHIRYWRNWFLKEYKDQPPF